MIFFFLLPYRASTILSKQTRRRRNQAFCEWIRKISVRLHYKFYCHPEVLLHRNENWVCCHDLPYTKTINMDAGRSSVLTSSLPRSPEPFFERARVVPARAWPKRPGSELQMFRTASPIKTPVLIHCFGTAAHCLNFVWNKNCVYLYGSAKLQVKVTPVRSIVFFPPNVGRLHAWKVFNATIFPISFRSWPVWI